MREHPDGGYDGPGPLEHSEDPVTFVIERFPYQYAITGIHCRLLRNGEPVGMIRLASEAEYEHLKERLSGVFDPTEHRDRREDHLREKKGS